MYVNLFMYIWSGQGLGLRVRRSWLRVLCAWVPRGRRG